MRRTLVALLACLGCSTPLHEYRVPHGVVRATTPEEAERFAYLADTYAPNVCRLLDVDTEPPFIIERVSASGRWDTGLRVWTDYRGRVTKRRIEIGECAVPNANYAVAHELVHWYREGVWDRLPHILEEGLADYIAIMLVPGHQARYRSVGAQQLAEITSSDLREVLSITEENRNDASDRSLDLLYIVGFHVVDRIGIDGLRNLCERAQRLDLDTVPLEWFSNDLPAPP